MATFGQTDTSGMSSTGTIVSNRFYGCKFYLAESGEVTSLSVYFDSIDTTATYYGVVYDDDGTSGDPGTLKGSKSQSLSSPGSGWKTFTFSSSFSLDAGYYWLGINQGFANYKLLQKTGETDQTIELTDSPAPDDPASTTVISRPDYELAIYATYTASSSDLTVTRTDSTTPAESVSLKLNPLNVVVTDSTTPAESRLVTRQPLYITRTDATTPAEVRTVRINYLTPKVTDSATPVESVSLQIKSNIVVSDGTTPAEDVTGETQGGEPPGEPVNIATFHFVPSVRIT